jgi:poly(3-hydroxybutyrate) depolymerase
MRRLWLRLRALFTRAYARARALLPPVAPGRFETGRAESWRGYVTTAPSVPPERDYVVYVPRGWSRWRRAPLLVLCHGCRQTPENFAALTHIVARADRDRMLVLLPRQSTSANPWGCWNWFEANTERGAGEAAIVAAQIIDVRRRYRARRDRVWVAGLSAGAALAAVLGVRHPRLVRGVLAHSGLACGAAASPASALRVMTRGPDTDVGRIGDAARAAQRDVPPLPVALLAIDGANDDVVAGTNGTALVQQFLRFNAYPRADGDRRGSMPAPDVSSMSADGDRHPYRCDDWTIDGALAVRRIVVDDLGHAWTGGDGRFDYADPRGPDALDLLTRFIAESAQGRSPRTSGARETALSAAARESP